MILSMVPLRKLKHLILNDESEQMRLHQTVAKLLGSIEGGNPMRAEQVRRTVRLRVSRDRARRVR